MFFALHRVDGGRPRTGSDSEAKLVPSKAAPASRELAQTHRLCPYTDARGRLSWNLPVGTAPTVAAKAPQLWSTRQATAMTQVKHRGAIPADASQTQRWRPKNHDCRKHEDGQPESGGAERCSILLDKMFLSVQICNACTSAQDLPESAATSHKRRSDRVLE